MIEDLEQWRRKKLLSQEEIKLILKKRRHFEYEVRKCDTRPLEYLRYIDYERHLHLLINKRCDQTALQQSGVIRLSGFERIRTLFDRAVRRYPAQLSLWQAYVEFLQQSCLDSALGDVFARALQLHPLCDQFWLDAAWWEFRRNKNVDAARALLSRALRALPSLPSIWISFFRLEMTFLDLIRKRIDVIGVSSLATTSSGPREEDHLALSSGDDESEDDALDANSSSSSSSSAPRFTLSSSFMAGALPLAVYRGAIRALPHDVDMRLGFIQESRGFAGYLGFRSTVYKDLLRDFPECPRVQDLWCRRAMLEASAEQMGVARLRALQAYEEMLGQARFEEDLGHGLWDNYASFLIGVCRETAVDSEHNMLFRRRLFDSFHTRFGPFLQNQTQSQQQQQQISNQKSNPKQQRKQSTTLKALQALQDTNSQDKNDVEDQSKQPAFIPSSGVWLQWVDILLACGLTDTAQQTLRIACTFYPEDLPLWRQAFRMSSLLQPMTLIELCKSLHTYLDLHAHRAESLSSLWMLYLEVATFHLDLDAEQLLAKLRTACTYFSKDFLARFKSKALHLLTVAGATVQQITSFYQFALRCRPNTLQFLRDCLDWEQAQLQPDPHRIRKLFSVGFDELGKTDDQIWLDAIRFEYLQNESNRVVQLYTQAKKNLTNPASFLIAYSQLESTL